MKRASRILIGLGLAAAVVLAVMLGGPRALGGPAEYLITQGSSMEPRLEQGDLVLLRRAESYETGDVIAYRSGDLRRVVLHRIVGIDDGRFVTKGDNNSWRDAYRPTERDVIGVMWFAVPEAGTVLSALRTPRTFAVVAALVTLLAVAGAGTGVERRRRRRRRDVDTPRRPWVVATPRATTVWIALAATGVALLGLAAGAFTAPSTQSAEELVPYEHSGAFTYSAKVAAGPVYEGRTLKPGEPVFLRLVETLPISYAYSLEADAIRDVHGTARISAELSDESGWRRVVELAPAVSFKGQDAAAKGSIDLRRIWRVLRQVQQTTGVRHETYGFALAATVNVQGNAAGTKVEERFMQRVAFRLDPLKLELVDDTSPTVGPASLLRAERGGSVTASRLKPATLTVLGRSVSVASVRRLSAGLGALWLLAWIAAALLVRGPAHEPARIRSRYASILVPVAGDAPDRPGAVVDVGTMEALVKVAESAGRLVLHRELHGAHTYVVDDDGPVYRYRAYESDDARAVALARETHTNGNGNGNGHAADRPGLVAQFLGAPGRER